jgi:biopolymer transport protein ExbB
MGSPSNFEGGVVQENRLTEIFSNGIQRRSNCTCFIRMFIMVIVFSLERYLVISKAAGKGNLRPVYE